MNRQLEEENIIEEQEYKLKSFGDLLKRRKPKKQKHKIDYRFQELGIEMQKYFKKNIWFLFTKYDELKLRDAFKICKKKGIKNIAYLLGIYRRMK